MNKVNENKKIIGKVIGFNKNKNITNVNIITDLKESLNIKFDENKFNLKQNQIYQFTVSISYNEEKNRYSYYASEISELIYLKDKTEMLKLFQMFFPKINKDALKMSLEIEKTFENFKNEILKNITKNIYYKNYDLFISHPGGLRFHHSYIGGLIHHTYSMLMLAKYFTKVYPFINKELLYSGIILHDIEKVNEFSGINGEYTREGQLLGHINMGYSLIEKVAKELEFDESEEVLCLKHLLLSHHGIPNFGSPKKPQILEALLLWHIDTIDSKIGAAEVELEKTLKGNFTEPIAACDKTKLYKPKFK